MAAFPSVRSTLPYLVGVAIAACRRRNNERQLRLVPCLGNPEGLARGDRAHPPTRRLPTKDMTGALRSGRRVILPARSIVRVPVKRAGGAKQTRRDKSHLAVGGISSGGCSGRFRKIGYCPPPAALHSSRFLPSSPGSRLSYRYTGCSPMQARSADICPFSPGSCPAGFLQLIAEQIMLISRQGNETLGTAFVVGLLIALVTANSGHVCSLRRPQRGLR